jgi:hypothetical protein
MASWCKFTLNSDLCKKQFHGQDCFFIQLNYLCPKSNILIFFYKQVRMIHFENLNQEELVVLENAVPQIAVLIAGADGKIDVKEEIWAEKVTQIRGFAGDKWLNDFYDEVHANFAIRFRDLVKSLPTETKERQASLFADLEKINPILAKLDAETAFKLYKSLKSYASQVAHASGGILGFHAVSHDEEIWLNLPMITPIEEPVD